MAQRLNISASEADIAMAKETELKLALPQKAAARLRRHPLLQSVTPHRLRLGNTYYDTADRLLEQDKIALRIRRIGNQRLQTVKRASPAAGGFSVRSEWETPMTGSTFEFSTIEDPALRNRLDALRDRLEPVFSTNFTRTAWIIHPDPDSEIELALDRGEILAGTRHERICEIELELVRGQPAVLFELARQLQHDLPLRPLSLSKAERGFALLHDRTTAARKADAIHFTPDLVPVEAFRVIALSCLSHLQDNEACWLANPGDMEALHQMHVALRRLRSAWRLFEPMLEPTFNTRWKPFLRTLNLALGRARNWDMLIGELLPHLIAEAADREHGQRLRNDCEQRRKRARRQIRTLLQTTAYAHFSLGLTAELYDGSFHGRADTAEAGTTAHTLTAFASTRLTLAASAAGERARMIDTLDAEERHRLRIACKELRYGVEFFATLYPPETVLAYLHTLERLQELLGLLNDFEVGRKLVASLRRNGEFDRNRWLAHHRQHWRNRLAPAAQEFLSTAIPWQVTST